MNVPFPLILCLLFSTGCDFSDKREIVGVLNMTAFPPSMSEEREKKAFYMIKLTNTNNLSRVYVVNDFVTGEEISSLRDYLAHHEKGDVIFRSDYKLVQKSIEELKYLFSELDFPVKQFWVPVSTFSPDAPYPPHPGWENLVEGMGD